MTTVSLATLVLRMTKAEIYDYAVGIATAAGLPVSSWQAGDPTRSLLHIEAELHAGPLQESVIGLITSRFLSLATGDWLKVKAEQDYGVTVPAATYATTDVALSNPSGFVHTVGAGDLVFKNTTTGKTYHSTTGGTLAAKVGATNGTLTVTVVADEAGSDSSASAGEIDALVTTLRGGVTCTNAAAAIGVDEQSEDATRAQCLARLSRLTPNGATGAYVDVALDSDLTGTSGITDARAYGDSDSGVVTLYLRGPSGAVSAADRTLVETAVLANCTPLCITPTVVSCAAVTVAITYALDIYKSVNKTAAEIAEDIETALEVMFAAQPIGGDIIAPAVSGKLYKSLIESTILRTFPEGIRVVVATPAGDTSLTVGQVAALGTVTATINLQVNP